MNFSEALKELRKGKKRNFDQTLDLIVNLRDLDLRRESLNTSAVLPFAPKKKKIAAFLENGSEKVDFVITKADIERMTADDIKKMISEYDFFLANAKLMPLIAMRFGKILGSAGKMPDPKLGCVLMQESEDAVASIVNKLSGTVKIKAKELSLKIAIGKESMPDEQLSQNADAVVSAVAAALPSNWQNIRSIMLKFTMTKPLKVKKNEN